MTIPDRHPIRPSSLTKGQVLDRYFLEHRAKLIDIAAFLDRVDRAEPHNPSVRRQMKIFGLPHFVPP